MSRFSWALVLALFCARPAGAFLEIGSDITLSGGLATELLSYRAYNRVFITMGGIGFGAIAYYEPSHSYLTDVVYGVGVRFGSVNFVQIDGGVLKRTFEGTKGGGYAATVQFGTYFGRFFRLSIPITAKRIQSGNLNKRWYIEGGPFLGLQVAF